MNDKYFIDTNIFVYAFDRENSEKNVIANNLVKSAIVKHKGCISYQVIQELLNVLTKKLKRPISHSDCKKYLDTVLLPLCEIFANIDLYHRALDTMERWQYSFYDSLIIAAAIQSDCNILYTEDLHHNQKIQSITILNPFISEIL
jgi:predicted nucleic acid-binding protein